MTKTNIGAADPVDMRKGCQPAALEAKHPLSRSVSIGASAADACRLHDPFAMHHSHDLAGAAAFSALRPPLVPPITVMAVPLPATVAVGAAMIAIGDDHTRLGVGFAQAGNERCRKNECGGDDPVAHFNLTGMCRRRNFARFLPVP